MLSAVEAIFNCRWHQVWSGGYDFYMGRVWEGKGWESEWVEIFSEGYHIRDDVADLAQIPNEEDTV